MSGMKLNLKRYHEYLRDDEFALSTFRGGNGILSRKDKRLVEYKIVKAYRLYQANHDNVWGKIFGKFFFRYSEKYGVGIGANLSIGRGLVIGHWGRIIVSGNAKIGNQLMITHGVTIGRDVRGARAGDPTLGNRVCIRANSTIVGKITIGDDVLIAPNTFVNFDVPSHSVVIGNPGTVHHKQDATMGHVGRLPNE